jgi:hypothetical protein
MVELVKQFANDEMVLLIAALVALDLVLGVSAALKNPDQAFRLSYVTDFLRNDILGKMVPYYAVWVAVNLGGDFELAGIPLIEDSVGALVVAALGASVLNSLRDMGLWKSAPDEVAGSDPSAGLPSPDA